MYSFLFVNQWIKLEKKLKNGSEWSFVYSEPGDELPWEKGPISFHYRKKIIHSVGVVGTFEWKSVENHPYTGVFKGKVDFYPIRKCMVEENSSHQFIL